MKKYRRGRSRKHYANYRTSAWAGGRGTFVLDLVLVNNILKNLYTDKDIETLVFSSPLLGIPSERVCR